MNLNKYRPLLYIAQLVPLT